MFGQIEMIINVFEHLVFILAPIAIVKFNVIIIIIIIIMISCTAITKGKHWFPSVQ